MATVAAEPLAPAMALLATPLLALPARSTDPMLILVAFGVFPVFVGTLTANILPVSAVAGVALVVSVAVPMSATPRFLFERLRGPLFVLNRVTLLIVAAGLSGRRMAWNRVVAT